MSRRNNAKGNPQSRTKNESSNNRNSRNNNSQRPDYTKQEDTPKRKIKKNLELIPRNEAQEDYLMALEDDEKHIVFGVGPAGTGKTYLAVQYAVKCLREGLIEKIVLVRPNVALDDKDIGYLPGSVVDKLRPLYGSMIDVLEEYYTLSQLEDMINDGLIVMLALAHIRGKTLKNCICIVDEAQNTTVTSMLSILTRLGDGAKLLITGDLAQADRGKHNGLRDFLSRHDAKPSDMIEVVKFSQEDAVRHPIIQDLLNMYPDETL